MGGRWGGLGVFCGSFFGGLVDGPTVSLRSRASADSLPFPLLSFASPREGRHEVLFLSGDEGKSARPGSAGSRAEGKKKSYSTFLVKGGKTQGIDERRLTNIRGGEVFLLLIIVEDRSFLERGLPSIRGKKERGKLFPSKVRFFGKRGERYYQRSLMQFSSEKGALLSPGRISYVRGRAPPSSFS